VRAVPRREDEKAITPEQLDRVRDRLIRVITDEGEAKVVIESGIPQPTLNAVVNQRKLGPLTLKRLARYFRHDSVDELLNGTQPAGYYASREEGLGVGYPKRGKVLDGLRHVLPPEVLDEAQRIVLPNGSREWTEVDWIGEVYAIANRWQRLHNADENGIGRTPDTPGHPPVKRM
jgi:hypothetical protein